MSILHQRELAMRAALNSSASDRELFAQRGLCTGQAAFINWDEDYIFREAYIRLRYIDLPYTSVQLSKLTSTTDRYIDKRLEAALERAGVPVGMATFFDDTDCSHGILATGYIEPELLEPFGAELVTNDIIEQSAVCCQGQPLVAPFLGERAAFYVRQAIARPASHCPPPPQIQSPVHPVAPLLPVSPPPIPSAPKAGGVQ